MEFEGILALLFSHTEYLLYDCQVFVRRINRSSPIMYYVSVVVKNKKKSNMLLWTLTVC